MESSIISRIEFLKGKMPFLHQGIGLIHFVNTEPTRATSEAAVKAHLAQAKKI